MSHLWGVDMNLVLCHTALNQSYRTATWPTTAPEQQGDQNARVLNGVMVKTWPPLFQKGAGRAESPDGSCAASGTMGLCLRTELINCACPLVTHPWTGPSTPKHPNDGTNKGQPEIDHWTALSVVTNTTRERQKITRYKAGGGELNPRHFHSHWMDNKDAAPHLPILHQLTCWSRRNATTPPPLRKAAEHKGGVTTWRHLQREQREPGVKKRACEGRVCVLALLA